MRLILLLVVVASMTSAALAQSTTPIGSACTDSAGRQSILDAPLPPTLGNLAFSLDISMAPANSTAWIYLATSAATAPLAVGGGCVVYLDLASVNALILAGVSPFGPLSTNLMGAASLGLPLPSAPGLAGTTVVAQAVTLDPALSLGFVLSNALQIVIG